MNGGKWTRYAPGLYVCPNERWVVTRDAPNFYTVRVLLGYGPTTSGKKFPDYGSIHYTDALTLSEAKACVEEMGDFLPQHDHEWRWAQIDRAHELISSTNNEGE